MLGKSILTATIHRARLFSLPLLLAASLCGVAVAPVTAGADDGVVPAFLIDRERRSPVGCDGIPTPPPASLTPSETLRTLAGRAASNPGSYDAFAAANGLAGIPSFFTIVQGSIPQDAANGLKSGWCPQLRSSQFAYVGVAKVQGGWAVLLAAREPQYVPAYQPDAPLQGGAPVQAAPVTPMPTPREGVTPLYEAAPATPVPVPREGVTPLYEATPGPITAVAGGAAASGAGDDLPDIGHPGPILTGPDGKPLPTTYSPGSAGVRVPATLPGALPEDAGETLAAQGIHVDAIPGNEPEPTIASAEAEAAAAAAGAPLPETFVKSPLSLETGDPAPAQPVPPVYSKNGVSTAADVERSGKVANVPPQAPSGGGQVDAELLRRVNEVRSKGYLCGRERMPAVPPLRENPLVARVAAAHAADMLARGYFSPVSPDGRRAGNRLTEAGYTWAVLAENIASGTPSAEAALKNWLGNESQCRNMMNPDYTEAGTGEAGGIRVLTLTAPLSGGALRLD